MAKTLVKSNSLAKRGVNRTLSILYKLVKKIRSNAADIIETEMCKVLEKDEMIASYHVRPENAMEIPALLYDSGESLAIVMQGPIRKERDFTLSSSLFYKRNYPSASIIVSTWEDEDDDYLEKFEKKGIIVVKNSVPESGGHLNINFQLISTRGGIEKAVELGAKYICKTRTDQCIRNVRSIEAAVNSIKTFPIIDAPDTANSRLVVASINYGNMFYPYFMTDFFYVGETSLIKLLFSCPLDTRKPFNMAPESTKREYAKALYAPEVYLLKNFLCNIGHECSFTVKDYWEAVKKYLICFDIKMLDLIWPKYDSRFIEHRFYGDFFIEDTDLKLKTMNFNYTTWFNLYCGTLCYDEKYEELADVVFK